MQKQYVPLANEIAAVIIVAGLGKPEQAPVFRKYLAAVKNIKIVHPQNTGDEMNIVVPGFIILDAGEYRRELLKLAKEELSQAVREEATVAAFVKALGTIDAVGADAGGAVIAAMGECVAIGAGIIDGVVGDMGGGGSFGGKGPALH